MSAIKKTLSKFILNTLLQYNIIEGVKVFYILNEGNIEDNIIFCEVALTHVQVQMEWSLIQRSLNKRQKKTTTWCGLHSSTGHIHSPTVNSLTWPWTVRRKEYLGKPTQTRGEHENQTQNSPVQDLASLANGLERYSHCTTLLLMLDLF